jgi:hypothetical protein
MTRLILAPSVPARVYRVYKDMHEDPNTISVIDIEPMVRVHMLEAHRQ